MEPDLKQKKSKNNYRNEKPGYYRLSHGIKSSRKYVIRIEATNEAGNVGRCKMAMFVDNDDSDGLPLFLLETVKTKPSLWRPMSIRLLPK